MTIFSFKIKISYKNAFKISKMPCWSFFRSHAGLYLSILKAFLVILGKIKNGRLLVILLPLTLGFFIHGFMQKRLCRGFQGLGRQKQSTWKKTLGPILFRRKFFFEVGQLPEPLQRSELEQRTRPKNLKLVLIQPLRLN